MSHGSVSKMASPLMSSQSDRPASGASCRRGMLPLAYGPTLITARETTTLVRERQAASDSEVRQIECVRRLPFLETTSTSVSTNASAEMKDESLDCSLTPNELSRLWRRRE